MVGQGGKGGPRGRGNRLRGQKSPYLLQHADNPVDWYPWGQEAFALAKQEDKPVFLSIGYSTCHWCHVMAHESFEDPEVARLMNETFVCVKVDREERPDIDNIYMAVCQLMTGTGGWPLTIIMTPEKVPFFAATYIPKESRWGRTGLLELIPRIKEIWNSKRGEVEATAAGVASALSDQSQAAAGVELDQQVLDLAMRQLAERYDSQYGGFGTAPKFPTPHNLLFLLRRWHRSGDERSLAMAENTLEMMRRGGIYDQVGFGFHRYSTDRAWLVPHFEKMLYDQALLILAYVEAYQATGRETYGRTAREIATYVLRDMTAPEGGFYSAEDADSEGQEGRFYLWTEDEIRRIITPDEADLVVRVFNIDKGGNFADQASGHRTDANILHMAAGLENLAAELGVPAAELTARLSAAREKLFAYRQKRIHPHKDDKVLTDWNGLMIAALARAGGVLGDHGYLGAAKRAAHFVLAQMRRGDGRLLHRYRDGEAGIIGNLNDYAFMVWGLIELYEATFQVDYLEAALDFNRDTLQHFWDDEKGGFYFTPDDGEDLLVRPKEVYDGAIPSGNSVSMLNMLRLSRLTADPELEKRAAMIGKAFSFTVSQMPLGYTQFLIALDFALGPAHEVVVVGKAGSQDTRAMMDSIRSHYLPNKVLLFRPAGEQDPEIGRLAGFTRQLSSLEGRATAYVCLDQACELPTTDPERVLDLLGLRSKRS